MSHEQPSRPRASAGIPIRSGKGATSAAGVMSLERRGRIKLRDTSVSLANLYADIERGWRHFWGKRGGAPTQTVGGWLKY